MKKTNCNSAEFCVLLFSFLFFVFIISQTTNTSFHSQLSVVFSFFIIYFVILFYFFLKKHIRTHFISLYMFNVLIEIHYALTNHKTYFCTEWMNIWIFLCFSFVEILFFHLHHYHCWLTIIGHYHYINSLSSLSFQKTLTHIHACKMTNYYLFEIFNDLKLLIIIIIDYYIIGENINNIPHILFPFYSYTHTHKTNTFAF